MADASKGAFGTLNDLNAPFRTPRMSRTRLSEQDQSSERALHRMGRTGPTSTFTTLPSPCPIPGATLDASLPAATDKSPGQLGLWITFTRWVWAGGTFAPLRVGVS